MRRIRRDAAERALPLEETLRLYETFARPDARAVRAALRARAPTTSGNRLDDPRFPEQLAAELKRNMVP